MLPLNLGRLLTIDCCRMTANRAVPSAPAIRWITFRAVVARGAREAEVAEGTVFNYFPTKEDLFYFRLETYGDRLLEAVERRPEGQSVLGAFRDYLLTSGGLLAQADAGDSEALERLRTVNGLIAASPALLAREQRAMERITNSMAALLAGRRAHVLMSREQVSRRTLSWASSVH
jgi:AcrR family transcriptional regulator